MADMIVSGAGTNAVNGTYAEYGTRDGKTRYRMASAESSTGYFYIVYPGGGYNMWCISVRGEDSDTGQQCLVAARYIAQENVATPDLVVTWDMAAGAAPAPTVTAAGGSAPDELTSTNVSFGTSVSKPTLTETASATALASKNISSATSVSKPAISQAHALASKNVSSGTSVSKPTIQVTVLLVSQDITSAVSVSKPSLTQHHMLASQDVTMGMSVSTNMFVFVLTSTPECRVYAIFAENRTLLIDAENRTHTIDAENRTLEVRCH